MKSFIAHIMRLSQGAKKDLKENKEGQSGWVSLMVITGWS